METDSEIEEVDSDEWYDDMVEINPANPILSNDCLFCPNHSATMTKNLHHMYLEHSFFIPDIEYVLDVRGLLLYLGEKVSRFYMCLWCNFRFVNIVLKNQNMVYSRKTPFSGYFHVYILPVEGSSSP